jgi:hypothetical protein
MTMLSLLLTFSFVALPQDPPEIEKGQEPEVEVEVEVDPPLTPEKATELLKTALKGKQIDLIFIAIEDAGRVADKNVVKQLGLAVKHKDAEIRVEALTALRFNQDPSAFKELLKFKKYKPVLENDACAEAFFFALGQKADVKAIPVLTDGLVKTNRKDKATRARILSLGRIRDMKSLEALISMMNSGGGGRRGGGNPPQMKEISLALQVLTGEEFNKRSDWQTWWNNNKKKVKISKKEQEASTRKARATWMTLWADPEEAELMKEALKKGKDNFGDADSEELQRLLEKAKKRKENKQDDGGEDGDSDDGKKDGADENDGAKLSN